MAEELEQADIAEYKPPEDQWPTFAQIPETPPPGSPEGPGLGGPANKPIYDKSGQELRDADPLRAIAKGASYDLASHVEGYWDSKSDPDNVRKGIEEQIPKDKKKKKKAQDFIDENLGPDTIAATKERWNNQLLDLAADDPRKFGHYNTKWYRDEKINKTIDQNLDDSETEIEEDVDHATWRYYQRKAQKKYELAADQPGGLMQEMAGAVIGSKFMPGGPIMLGGKLGSKIASKVPWVDKIKGFKEGQRFARLGKANPFMAGEKFRQKLGKAGRGGQFAKLTTEGALEGGTAGMAGSKKEGFEDTLDEGLLMGTAGGLMGSLSLLGGTTGSAVELGSKRAAMKLGGHTSETFDQAVTNPYARHGMAPDEDQLLDEITGTLAKGQKKVRDLWDEGQGYLSHERVISVSQIEDELFTAAKSVHARVKKRVDIPAIPDVRSAKVVDKDGNPVVLKKGTPATTGKKHRFVDKPIEEEHHKIMAKVKGYADENGKLSERELYYVLGSLRERTKYGDLASGDLQMNKYRKKGHHSLNKILKDGNDEYKNLMQKSGGMEESTDLLTLAEKSFKVKEPDRLYGEDYGKRLTGYQAGDRTKAQVENAINPDRKRPFSRKLVKKIDEQFKGKIAAKVEGAKAEEIRDALWKKKEEAKLFSGRGWIRGGGKFATGLSIGTAAATAGAMFGAVPAGLAATAGVGYKLIEATAGKQAANLLVRAHAAGGKNWFMKTMKKIDPALHQGIYRVLREYAVDEWRERKMLPLEEAATERGGELKDMYKDWQSAPMPSKDSP